MDAYPLLGEMILSRYASYSIIIRTDRIEISGSDGQKIGLNISQHWTIVPLENGDVKIKLHNLNK